MCLEVIRRVSNADVAITGRECDATGAAPARNRCGGRHISRKRVANGVHLPLERTEIKELVRNDASADTATVLLQVEGRLRRSDGVEVVARVEFIRAAEGICRAMNLVCP